MSQNDTPEQPTPSRPFPSRALMVFTLSAALLGLLDSRRLSGFLERLDLPGARQGAELVRDAAHLSGASLVSDAEARLLRQLTPSLTLGNVAAETDALPVVAQLPQQARQAQHNATSPQTPQPPQLVADTSVPQGLHNAATVTTEPVLPVEEPLPPAQIEKPRVLIVGDSLIMEGLGPALLRTLRKNVNLEVRREGRYSTGLTRTDTFDWPQHLRTLIPEHKPDLVVVCLGANDFQDILIEGKRHIAGTETWNTLYRERADAFLAEATQLGAQVVWLGLPIMGNETYEKRIRGLSDLQEAACKAIEPMCLFADNLRVLADENGKYLSHIVDAKGKHIRLRYKDKIHVTEPAGEMITAAVLPMLNELLQPKIDAFVAYEKEQAEAAKQTDPAKQTAPQPTSGQTTQPAQPPVSVPAVTKPAQPASTPNEPQPAQPPTSVPTAPQTVQQPTSAPRTSQPVQPPVSTPGTLQVTPLQS